jgi:hypothetical protein
LTESTPIELRVELYSDQVLPAVAREHIGNLLTRRWPLAWDLDAPERPTREHPMRWRTAVPLPAGSTPESLHRQLESDIQAAAFEYPLHLRTRWSFPQSPNHQEIYEVNWIPRVR